MEKTIPRPRTEAPEVGEEFRTEAERRFPDDPTAVYRLLAECEAKAKAALRYRRASQLRDRLYDLVAVHKPYRHCSAFAAGHAKRQVRPQGA